MGMKELPVTPDDLRPVRPAEIARRMGISRMQVSRMVAAGRLHLNPDGLVEHDEYVRLLEKECIAWRSPGGLAAVEAHRLSRS